MRVRSDVRGHGQVRLCKALGCGRCGCLKPIRACCVVGSAFFFACLTRARRVCTSSQARKEAWASAGGRRPRSANKRDTASEGARSGRRWSRLRLSALANISWHLAGLSPFAPVGRRGRHQEGPSTEHSLPPSPLFDANPQERKGTRAKYHKAFHAPSLIALCGGDRNEETPSTENEREVLMRRACARTPSPRSFLLLEHRLQPTPSPLCGLASWPLLDACSMFPGE